MNEQQRFHPSIVMFPDSSGNFIRWPEGGFGAGPRYRTADRTHPRPPRNTWLVARKTETSSPEIMKFDGNQFRSPTGASKGIVWEWCELILDEPTTETQPGPVQPLSAPGLLQAIVNLAYQFYKRGDVLDAGDRSPYNNPNEGAPEE